MHSPVGKLHPQLTAQPALSSTLMVKTNIKKNRFGLGQDLMIIGV
jgi:hypothetical protein